ncbi:hypothetical protein [Marinicella litoralis]|uniref:Uncharacterized protein n=1 Tax=Marinicella litoralis TaxID=644220 RepID=A0A4R6XUU7_9GAMM|nr:hypothetical protein [Marinicella litoralis]TDR23616.1 hypothetical protein C8D91_0480 [Marinicella litoralis]
MKILLPFLTLFLASCGVHHHRYDAEQDTYYQDDYYAYDNYDPYYGYGSAEYSSAGDGVYYNNYNYYPDRWGVNYSNVYYSPYRYPRVGFYYSSINNCGYSYWSTWCSPGAWPSSYYSNGWWPSFGFGLSYSVGYSGYYDNYWWYNHYRHRNYNHNRPTQRGYYSARNETRRLANSRYHNQSKKPNHNRYGNKPQAVNRARNSSNRPVNRAPNRSNSNSRQRSSTVNNRARQEAAVINHSNQNRVQNNDYQSARSQVVYRSSSSQLLQQNSQNNVQRIQQNHEPSTQMRRNRYQSAASSTDSISVNQNIRVKPMNSQSPVYHTNTIRRQTTTLQRPQINQRQVYQNTQPSVNHQSGSRVQLINRSVPSRPQVQTSKPVQKPKPQRSKQEKSAKNSSKNKPSRAVRSNDRGRRN